MDRLRVTITWTQKESLWASKRHETISLVGNKSKYLKMIRLFNRITKEAK